MKLLKLSLLFALAAFSVAAQSARVKATPTPTPNPNLRPAIIYIPSAQTTKPKGTPIATPTPTAASRQSDDDVVKVESTLVPIPVSVIDSSGRAVSNLK